MMAMQIILQQITFLLSLINIIKYCTILSLLWAQDGYITGIVISYEDKTPIHGVNVFSEKIGVGTVSNVDGSFSLKILSEDTLDLTFSMVGFKNLHKIIAPNKLMYDLGTITMFKDTLVMDKIIVDAHHELHPKGFTSNIVVAGDKFHTKLKSSLALTIEEEAGLSTRSLGQATTQPVLRGYSGDRFLLTEDGISIGDLSNTSIDHITSLDMASFNTVRIIRGPEALLFGSNTIGGVINVSRQANIKTRFDHVHVMAVSGFESSNSSIFGNITSYIPIRNQQFRFSSLYRKTGDQSTPIGTLDNTALSNYEVTGSYSFFGKDNRSTITLEQINMTYGVPGSYEGHIDGVDINMKKNSQKFNYHKDISLLGFQIFDIDQRYISYKHTEFEKGAQKPSVIMNQDILTIQSGFRGSNITIGSLFKYRIFQAGGFYWTPDAEELSMAIYGLYEKNLRSITLQVSSRFEYLKVIPNKSSTYLSNFDTNEIVDRNFPIFSTAASLLKNWNGWNLSFGLMSTERSPSIENLYSDGPHLGTYAYEIGDPKLGLEKTIGVETSLEHNTSKGKVRFTSFYNKSPNYHLSSKMGDGYEPGADWIEWGSGSSGWLYKYQMVGLRSTIYGFESNFSYKINKSIYLHGNISVSRGENLSKNNPLSYMPPDKALLSTEFDLKPFSAELKLKKVSLQSRLGEFETKTDGFFLVDLHTSYTTYSSKITHKIILSIDNIFNEVYYNHLSRTKLIMPEIGRNISIHYRIIL